MSPDPSKLSDAELSALVAEKVAGWKRLPLNPPGTWGYDIHWQDPRGNTSNYDSFPPYATSADAVLPLLEKPQGRVEMAHNEGLWWCHIQLNPSIISEAAPTFPRAACLAILAAAESKQP
jgi:hypothetical protein